MELNAEVVTPHISINALKKTIDFHTLRVTYKENKHGKQTSYIYHD
jgi:hypothetical protein